VKVLENLGAEMLERNGRLTLLSFQCLIAGMEIIVPLAEISIAMATGILAFFTYRLAGETHKTTQEARSASYREIGVLTWLDLEKRFDSTEMKAARRDLATIMN
jgi:hypothetical protein